MNAEPISHYALTTKQRSILNLLYRFRFATSEQLSQTLGITKSTMNKRLKLLVELNYVGRKFEPEYHLLRKHASYFLLPEGTKVLKKLQSKRYSTTVLQNIRKNDQNASEPFVNHWLAVFDAYRALKMRYGADLQFFTKSQVTTISYFPKQLPDAYIQLSDDKDNTFFLNVLHEGRPFFLATRSVVQYIEYANSERRDFTNSKLPKMLFVCDGLALERRLLKKMKRTIENLGNLDIKFYIATLDELGQDKWVSMAEPTEVLSLTDIS